MSNATWLECWNGSIRITDMTNAGKRGKTCETYSVSGGQYQCTDGSDIFHQMRYKVIAFCGIDVCQEAYPHRGVNADYTTIKAMMVAAVEESKVCKYRLDVYERVIRGIDAPKEVLSAGVEGLWSASANEDGISITDDQDRNNEPACITSGQPKSEAYRIAKKVWPWVEKATTFHEAWTLLSNAGARLHYYCRMD